MKLQALTCIFTAKESPAQMFSCEFSVTFKKTFFKEPFLGDYYIFHYNISDIILSLKMVLHGHPEKLSKISEIWKVSATESRFSQTIFLRSTVILLMILKLTIL